ncbi:MAG: Glu-tRNA(Gln) amidotransferase subunit GatE [Nanoarchaeota archaeon]
MTADLDFGALGFRCGIEIHQQLDGRKLFCDCPVDIRKGDPQFVVRRRLRASAGESGAVDAAAAHEQGKAKSFAYECYHDNVCLVELDEEPPHQVNRHALEAAVMFCRMVDAKVVDRVQVMRKVVIDGSNVSGFQRTMLIGRDGFVQVDGRRIVIESIYLEEESAQSVSRKRDVDTYNLSRLGIPLIEVQTGPDIRDPLECRDVAAKIGMLLRSTGACRRGIGSIRQDVNLSIKGGSRVEVKGFQDLRSIPKVIDAEIARQLKVIRQGKKVISEVRKAEPDLSTSFLRPMPGAARMYPETDIPPFVPDVDVSRIAQTIEQRLDVLAEMDIEVGIAKELVKQDIVLSDFTSRFPSVDPKFIAEVLVVLPKEIRRKYGKDIDVLSHVDGLLQRVQEGKMSRSAVMEALVDIAHGRKVDFSRFEMVSDARIEDQVREAMRKNPGVSQGALMGLVMAQLRGRVDGRKVKEIVDRVVGK